MKDGQKSHPLCTTYCTCTYIDCRCKHMHSWFLFFFNWIQLHVYWTNLLQLGAYPIFKYHRHYTTLINTVIDWLQISYTYWNKYSMFAFVKTCFGSFGMLVYIQCIVNASLQGIDNTYHIQVVEVKPQWLYQAGLQVPDHQQLMKR